MKLLVVLMAFAAAVAAFGSEKKYPVGTQFPKLELKDGTVHENAVLMSVRETLWVLRTGQKFHRVPLTNLPDNIKKDLDAEEVESTQRWEKAREDERQFFSQYADCDLYKNVLGGIEEKSTFVEDDGSTYLIAVRFDEDMRPFAIFEYVKPKFKEFLKSLYTGNVSMPLNQLDKYPPIFAEFIRLRNENKARESSIQRPVGTVGFRKFEFHHSSNYTLLVTHSAALTIDDVLLFDSMLNMVPKLKERFDIKYRALIKEAGPRKRPDPVH